MRVLAACEFSGVVREAFKARGHTAWSCDLEETYIPGNHYKCDVREIVQLQWDLMVVHPPCTYLSRSGQRWHKDKLKEKTDALEFVKFLLEAPINKICLENPVGLISSSIRQPDQYIQPYQFGHVEIKKTGLWLKNLPKLKMTELIEVHDRKAANSMGEQKRRSKYRSITYTGIAEAMAEQWG